MVAYAAADTVVGAERALVNPGCILGTLGAELLLLGCSGLDNTFKLFLLCLKVLLADFDAACNLGDGILAFCNCNACLSDVLLRNLAKEYKILEFLVDGIELTAVCHIGELLLVLCRIGIDFHHLVLVFLYAFLIARNHFFKAG